MSHTPVEITQQHIDRITKVARNLARTQFGKLSGTDELESQGLLVLWELAMSYDPERGPPRERQSFNGYLSKFGRLRLIDWLRREHGRYDKEGGARLLSSTTSESIGDTTTLDDRLPIPENTDPLDIIIAREELREHAEVIDTELSARAKASLLYPLTHDTAEHLARDQGVTAGTVAAQRSRARDVVTEKIKDSASG